MLRRSVATPDLAAWRRFLSSTLLGFGSLLVLSGVIFFFAYNWAALHRFGKLGLLLAALVAACVTAWRLGEGLPSQFALLFAAVLVGPLLAVYGQAYQTGADAYELFVGWSVLILPWVVLARFSPLWLLLLLLLNTGLGLFWTQVFESYEDETMVLTHALLNGAAWGVYELFAARGVRWLRGRWMPRVLAVMTVTPLLGLSEELLFTHSPHSSQYVAFGLLVGVLGAMYFFHRRVHSDLFFLTLGAVCVMTLVTSLAGKHLFDSGSHSDHFGELLLMALIVIGEVGLAVWWLRAENRRMPEAESMSFKPSLRDVLPPELQESARAALAARQELTSGAPWYINALTGFGAWVASLFLISCLSLIVFASKGMGSLVLGLILTTGAVFMRRKSHNVFLTQLVLAMGLAGQGMFIGGVAALSDSESSTTHDTIIFSSLFVFQLVLLFVYPDVVQRFLSTVFASVALLILVRLLGPGALVDVGVVGLALLVHLLFLNQASLESGPLRERVTPAAFGLATTFLWELLVRTVFPNLYSGFHEHGSEQLPAGVLTMGLAAVTLYSAWRVLREVGTRQSGPAELTTFVSLGLMAVLTLQTPGVIATCGLLLLAFTGAAWCCWAWPSSSSSRSACTTTTAWRSPCWPSPSRCWAVGWC